LLFLQSGIILLKYPDKKIYKTYQGISFISNEKEFLLYFKLCQYKYEEAEQV